LVGNEGEQEEVDETVDVELVGVVGVIEGGDDEIEPEELVLEEVAAVVTAYAVAVKQTRRRAQARRNILAVEMDLRVKGK
jgi:hypothetical protein